MIYQLARLQPGNLMGMPRLLSGIPICFNNPTMRWRGLGSGSPTARKWTMTGLRSA
jgi:hypothetical protein